MLPRRSGVFMTPVLYIIGLKLNEYREGTKD